MLRTDDAAALESADHIAVIARGMIGAMAGDQCEAAFGLVTVSKLMAGDDPADRAALARWMVRQARELDPDALCPPWWSL
jgi:hypothetical protein